jgi:drug/metabolite transporter (DMT)-like permease
LNPAYVLAALGSVLYGGADFCGGFAARRSNALAVTFLSGFAGLAVLLVGMPFAPGVTRGSDLMWGAAGGVFGGVGAMLVYRALAIGPVSVASPIFSVTGLALPVIVGTALGERPSWVALAGLALSPVAIVLLGRGAPSGPEAAHDPRRAVVPSLTAGAVLGFFLVFLGRIERGADLWPLVVARATGLAVLLAALLWRRQPLLPRDTARGLALATGGLDSLANLVYVTAVQRGTLSLVAALVSLAPATTVLLGRAVFAERWSAPQRAGLLLALAAGVCISVG